MYFDQSQFDLRCEWGLEGATKLAAADAIVIVDVFSFTTSVDVALSREAVVLPYPYKQEAAGYARAQNAVLAGPRDGSGGQYSLSPSSLLSIHAGTRIVLPSPNGSNIAFAAIANGATVLAACLRNASAVAAWITRHCKSISVIPAGERWPDGTLRPAIEDLVGAGAILRALPGSRSPEAQLAVAAFQDFATNMRQRLLACSSGRELVERGFSNDVELAIQYDISKSVPLLNGVMFVNAADG